MNRVKANIRGATTPGGRGELPTLVGTQHVTGIRNKPQTHTSRLRTGPQPGFPKARAFSRIVNLFNIFIYLYVDFEKNPQNQPTVSVCLTGLISLFLTKRRGLFGSLIDTKRGVRSQPSNPTPATDLETYLLTLLLTRT